jgi:meiotically up-regulated gene 157 (Mug157) protein
MVYPTLEYSKNPKGREIVKYWSESKNNETYAKREKETMKRIVEFLKTEYKEHYMSPYGFKEAQLYKDAETIFYDFKYSDTSGIRF